MERLPVRVEAVGGQESERKAQGGIRFLTRSLSFSSDKRVELYNITPEIEALILSSGVKEGVLHISSLHTTTALFINEYQQALLEDIKGFLERLVAQDAGYEHECQSGRAPGYKHNCERCSDCDRKNADAHLRATLLGHSLCLPISKGELALGQWQSIILAELDGPRERNILVQIIGS